MNIQVKIFRKRKKILCSVLLGLYTYSILVEKTPIPNKITLYDVMLPSLPLQLIAGFVHILTLNFSKQLYSLITKSSGL